MVLGSRNIHYVVVKLIILLLLSTTSLKAEDYSWSIEKINEKNVMVSMNGQIQHGDRLYFFIPSGNCNRVENLFTFYTAANNSNLTNLRDQPLAIKINDIEVYGDVRFMFPMLMGHQVWISIGNYDLDSNMRLVFYPAVIGWILIGSWIAQLRFRIKLLEIKKENI